MIKKTINAWMIAMLIIPVCWAGENNAVDLEKIKNREEKVKEFIKAGDAHIDFYGKVVDQNGDPVEEAQVTMQMGHFDPTIPFYFKRIENLIVKTDKKGFFELKKVTGDGILITTIEKKGYEFLVDMVERNYYYSPGAQKKHHPNPANPIIFTMRKKEAATFVIPGNFNLSLSAGSEMEIDLVKRRAVEAGKLGTSKLLKDEHVDIRVKAKLSEDQANYNITFTTPDENSGIIEREEILYVVPEGGYQPSITITVPVASQFKKYLYIKSRQGSLYARLDIDIRANKENISLNIKSWTNPNSERNVDFDEEFYAQEELHKHEENKRKAIEREERKKLKQQKQ